MMGPLYLNGPIRMRLHAAQPFPESNNQRDVGVKLRSSSLVHHNMNPANLLVSRPNKNHIPLEIIP